MFQLFCKALDVLGRLLIEISLILFPSFCFLKFALRIGYNSENINFSTNLNSSPHPRLTLFEPIFFCLQMSG